MYPNPTTTETFSSLIQDLRNGDATWPADAWIIENEGEKNETYESKRIRDVASECGLVFRTYSVDDFQLVSNHENALFLNGVRVAPPTIVLARTGAETSPLGFSVLNHLEALGLGS